MARYTGPACRLCRRIGEKLFLKGERCFTPKCAVDRRRRPPGDHIPRRRRVSDRGIQLREKQKARFTYGILERQFRRYFEEAKRRPEITGQYLIQLLERRLDNVVFRLGFADSRDQARQWVLHRHFLVNGRIVNIPSFRVKPGDVIQWKESSTKTRAYEQATEGLPKRPIPGWLDLDVNAVKGSVQHLPKPEEVESNIETRLVVEHYSR